MVNTWLDLSAYIGQTVTIEFRTADCTFGGHYCYAYIDAGCKPLEAAVSYCSGASSAILICPQGYNSYQWLGPNSMTPITGATNDTLVINSPSMGDNYFVQATDLNGCTTLINSTIAFSTLQINGVNSSTSCLHASTGNAEVFVSGSGNGYHFIWTDSVTGNIIGGDSSSINNIAAGTYSVIVNSPGCGQSDTTIIVSVAFPTIYSLQQNFCNPPFTLNAPAGTNYQWYDTTSTIISGAATSTLLVNTPINNAIWTVAFDNGSGCRDSVKIILKSLRGFSMEAPYFCGDSVILNVPANATNIIWQDAYLPYTIIGTTDSIVIYNPTDTLPYTATYTDNVTGCKDSVVFYLQGGPLPPPASISQNGDTLISTPGPYYYWLLNGTFIAGAYSQTYVPLQSGIYSVIIGTQMCGQDTSLPFTFTLSGTNQSHFPKNEITVFPNPAHKSVTVQFERTGFEEILIVDVMGKLIHSESLKPSEKNKITSLDTIAQGIYFVRAIDSSGKILICKLIIE